MDPFEPGFLNRLPAPPKKVVIVRASRIGDFLCATPAVRALRAALPQAEFAFIGLAFVRELVMRSPHLDRFIEFPGFPGMAEQFFDARRALPFFQEMQAEQFDLAIQLHGSGTYANPFTLMLGARDTVGFVSDPHWPSRLDAACLVPTEGHEVDRWLALSSFLGAPAQGRETEFPLWRTDRVVAGELLAGAPRPLIGIHPGTREEPKRWPIEHFSQAAQALQMRLGGTVVVIGGAKEQELGDEIARHAKAGMVDLTGRLALTQAGAVIGEMAILLTNDSGPAHIAYALGTPSVTIFGDTDPARWGPPPLPRHQIVVPPLLSPEHLEQSPDNSLIARIPASQVVDAAVAAIGEAQGKRDA